MSVWRKKAIECAPELQKDFREPNLTPTDVFIELVPIVVQAHIDKDNERLQKIYDYAEWCHNQKDEKLWNAVGITFYLHLLRYPEAFLQFGNWIKKDIFLDIRDLLYSRLDDEEMQKLDNMYGYKGNTNKWKNIEKRLKRNNIKF